MSTNPLTLPSGASGAPDRCIARGRRILQVKFVALPQPVAGEPARTSSLLSRILGLLPAARR